MSETASEIIRIKRRIAKAQRRISRGYQPPPDKKIETEEHRLERLQKRLQELETPFDTEGV